jgi:hypothetical protein
MKQNCLTLCLLAILLISCAFSVIMPILHFRAVAKSQVLQQQIMQINRNLAFFQGLWSDSVNYSRTNPKLVPILKSYDEKRSQMMSKLTNSPAYGE